MNRKRRSPAEKVLTGLAAGLAGGLVASYVMNRFQAGLSQVAGNGKGGESQQSQQGGEESADATMKAADAIATSVFHRHLTREEQQQAGPFVHYAFGATMGAAYGVLAELNPAAASGFGLPFAAALWLAADEVAVPALGLSKQPTETPASTHVSAFAAHLVYGLSTDVVRRGISAMLQRR